MCKSNINEEHIRQDRRYNIVIDTDTYNEVDDQFALAYALRNQEIIHVEAIYAAPFSNERAATPKEGMLKSYEEIDRILGQMDLEVKPKVCKGSTHYLKEGHDNELSEAVIDLIERARQDRVKPLIVVAIGAITNIANALRYAPDISEKIKVIWLGGHGLTYDNPNEFNLIQDPLAAHVVFNAPVSLVHFPCQGVVSHLNTTIMEANHYLGQCQGIGAYLLDILKDYDKGTMGWSKIIWDLAPVAWLVNPQWFKSWKMTRPSIDPISGRYGDIIENEATYESIYYLERDPIFGDLFEKLSL